VARPSTVYSAEVSIGCARVAAGLVERDLVDLVYVSTTDYIQHKHAEHDPVGLDFVSLLDEHVGRLHEAGAVVGLTADHGMNAKQNADGSPRVVYLVDELDAAFAELDDATFRVILPITDPYVVHHGALGSFASVYLDRAVSTPELRGRIRDHLLRHVPGVCEVHDRDTAAVLMELPPDRIGDLVVLSDRVTVLGTTEANHDLSAVRSGLRSHGGRSEELVPLFVSRPLVAETEILRRDLRNSDIFDLTLNGWKS
jgi:phosphonoacetate hydrolase